MLLDMFRPAPELPINPVPLDMRFVAGGSFTMGADNFYPEEAPRRQVSVTDFWIDTTPVTNIEFEAFVDATGYETTAERGRRGSLVFEAPGPEIDLRQWGTWWRQRADADWRHPNGAGSDLEGRMEHPVVHVSHDDAAAYAAWCQKALPTEAEWEFAARGGLDGTDYAWGNELTPRGRQMANVWQGAFPYENLVEDGYPGTSPVRSFPANGYGLYDMIGNVWEWTTDTWREATGSAEPMDCCAPANPRLAAMLATTAPGVRRVLKGGSHLCARNLNHRYRPAARQPELGSHTTNDIGFRCVYRP